MRHAAVRVLAVLLIFCCHAVGQQRQLTIQNLSPHPRLEWFSVAVPFAEGEVVGVPDLHVEGHGTVWQVFGARWPDGSTRQALCMFRHELAPNRDATLTLVEGAGPPLEVQPAPELPFEIEVSVWQDGEARRAKPRLVGLLEQNAARKVALLRCRIPNTGLVFELILEIYTGQEHVAADVGLFFSDPTTKAMKCHVERVTVECKGAALMLRHVAPLAIETALNDDGSTLTLLVDQTLGDGQGIRRAGVVVPALIGDGSLRDRTILAAATAPPLGATDWRASGAFGPFGHVPDPPPWLRGAAARAAIGGRHARFLRDSARRGDPFKNFPHGLAKRAGQTGDQADFGVVKLEAVAGTGVPSFLLETELSVLQEACRPVHYFEADGAPVQARDHPDWVVWSGRTHWHCEVSVDRLGKPCPAPKLEAHDWTGKDRQHWSSLYLTGFYLLTGKHWALREIENEVQIYLAAQTIDPRFTTSGPGAPRGAGRVMLTACWLYQCTGDEALLQRMHDRMNKIYARKWVGATQPDAEVRPFSVHRPDKRMLEGKSEYWTPWQDALAVVGFAAFHRLTRNRQAGEIAEALALNNLRHGWRVTDGKAPIIATAIRWSSDGAALTDEERRSADKRTVLWSNGTAFSVWAIGSVVLARHAAQRSGDEKMAARAEKILRHLRSTRRRPSNGWFDRFGEWDALR